MNFGIIIRNALQRAELPFDVEHLELARAYANDNIQDLWHSVKADFRQSAITDLSVVASTDTYILPKDYDGMVLNALRGPTSNPRNIIYKDPIEFYRFTRNYATSTGVPNIFTFGSIIGYDTQLPAASVIKVASTLANYATGTVTVSNGSNRVIGAGGATFTRNMIGLRFQKTGDTTVYKIATFVSSAEVQLDANYRGGTSSGSTYIIGDVGIKVGISGVVSGNDDYEEVILNGTSVQTTTKSFTTVTGVVKSDLSGGTINCTDNATTTTVASLAPAEYEIERQTIYLWRVPASAETLTYKYFRKHPVLRNDMDKPLIITKYHHLIQKMTEADLREFADRTIPSKLASDITNGRQKFRADADDCSLWTTIPQEEGLGFGLTDINNRSIDQDFVSI
jgi:hypothetical protein